MKRFKNVSLYIAASDWSLGVSSIHNKMQNKVTWYNTV